VLSKQRFTALALLLQGASLVILSQTWYSISMSPDGNAVLLGDYTGADANPSALATSGFAALTILILAFSSGLVFRLVAGIGLFANAAMTYAVMTSFIANNISSLDSELDRLTGIAGTHGINDLDISQESSGWIWLVVEISLILLLAYGCVVAPQRKQATAKRSAAQVSTNLAKRAEPPASTIDLWDEQRR
jgi:hypothetical protein